MNEKNEKKVRILDDEYAVKVFCTNCGRFFTAGIRKGYTVEESLKTSPPCPNCGCTTLVSANKEQ